MFDIYSRTKAIVSSSAIVAGLEFKATSNHGFHICLPNGYTVSVQWGGGKYADNHDSWDFGNTPMRSSTAEVAVINSTGDLIETPFNPHDTVIGWQSMKDVKKIVEWASELEA
jgi:hypothetical protein